MYLMGQFIELLFDVDAELLDITLVVQKKDNLQRFYWGIISISHASLATSIDRNAFDKK